MYRAVTILPLLALWLYTMKATLAQERIYNYRHFTVQNGLPGNQVRDAAQDRQGLVWITTNKGLCYYDGHSFFTISLDKKEAAISNDLGRLSLGQDHKIWITTFNQGLADIHLLPYFTDTTASAAASYIYAVTAIDSWGNQSILSPTSTVSAVAQQKIILPEELYVRNLSAGIEVFWSEVSFTSGEKYLLYRKVGGQSTYTQVAAVDPGKPYVDSDVRVGQLYDYQLKTSSGKDESKTSVTSSIRRF